MSTLYMFPPNEQPTEDAEILAGEYALGVLDAGEAAATRLRADADPSLLGAIGAWQARLAPMTEMLQDVPPPQALWDRLAVDIGLAPPPRPELARSSDIIADVVRAIPPLPDPEPEALAQPEEEATAQEDPDHKPVVQPPADRTPNHPPAPEPAPAPEPEPEPVPAPAAPFWLEPVPVIDDLPRLDAAVPIVVSPVGLSASSSGLHTAAPAPGRAMVRGGAFARLALAAEPVAVAAPARPVPPVAATGHDRLFERVAFWRATTAVAVIAALAFALFAVLGRPGATTGVAAIGVVNAPAPIYLAEADSKGGLRVTPLALIAVPNGRDLQLWMIPPGSDAPVSLGVLPPGGQTVTLGGVPAEGTRFIVSMEPRGGATGGKITGQVLYGGTLANR